MNQGTGGQSGEDKIKNQLQASPDTVFNDKSIVDPETVIDENRIVGRDEQLSDVISYIRPALQGDKPENMLLYGPSGTGKSLITNAVCRQVRELAKTSDIDFCFIQLNCRATGSHDEAVHELTTKAAEKAGVSAGVPRKGISTGQKLKRLYEILDNHFESVIIALDEIDLLTDPRQRPDEEPVFSKLIYQLSRAKDLGPVDGHVSVVALTNRPNFMDDLDSRADSSFSPEDIIFPDYDAKQLEEILEHRRDAFREDALEEEVIPTTAQFAAKDHGDARKAIKLIKKAGTIADRNTEETVTTEHVEMAQEQLETDRTLNQMRSGSTHKRLALYATAISQVYADQDIEPVPSTIAYQVYQHITREVGEDVKSRESFRRYMNQADTAKFVNAGKEGRGFGKGVYNVYSFGVDAEVIAETLESKFESEDNTLPENQLEEIVQDRVGAFYGDE